MNFFLCLFIFFLPLTFSYPRRHAENSQDFLNPHFKQRAAHSDDTDGKFGSSRQYMFRLMPLHYQPPNAHPPSCLPHVWTCGPNLPPCCPGLMCYDGNAKRGRHCVARG